ncbi:hypothetical protein RJZ56_001248 [Blastomyces dermatitidis]
MDFSISGLLLNNPLIAIGSNLAQCHLGFCKLDQVHRRGYESSELILEHAEYLDGLHSRSPSELGDLLFWRPTLSRLLLTEYHQTTSESAQMEAEQSDYQK